MFDSAGTCEVARSPDKPGDGKSLFQRLRAQDFGSPGAAEGAVAELGQRFRLRPGSGRKIRRQLRRTGKRERILRHPGRQPKFTAPVRAAAQRAGASSEAEAGGVAGKGKRSKPSLPTAQPPDSATVDMHYRISKNGIERPM
ncbi:MAG TPA: hypothetical protein VMT53_14795 [Terriglobales bacterium]|nr:hypothetical protein [Terriglobales bacterium]